MYRALYRKWRPQVFSDVSGQPHITSTLQNEVLTGRLSHAYLFTGSRGTGKTSCAKILAKAVNCLNPQNGNPCNECEMCRGIDSGAVLDVTEIDAASNNGVDNIRELREEANFTPSSAKYRVYIIDEVHMLSQGAFNALLKTLEEPPEYVLFILATTEVHKLPATILSRCQRFDFKRIPPEDIRDRLMFVAGEEKIDLDDDAALLIARIADGALRDALSVLDRCAGQNERVTLTSVSDTAGLLGREYLFSLSDAIRDGDCAAALSTVDVLHNSSCDMERLLSELVNHFRNIMIAKTVKKPEGFIICTPDELTRLRSAAEKFTYGTILSVTEQLCAAGDTLRRSANQRAQVETLLIKLCTPSLTGDVSALQRRVDELESRMKMLLSEQVVYTPAPVPEQKTESKAEPVSESAKAPEEKEANISARIEPDLSEDDYDEPPFDDEREASLFSQYEADEPKKDEADEPAESEADVPAEIKADAPAEIKADAPAEIKPDVPAPAANEPSAAEGEAPFELWQDVLDSLKRKNPLMYAVLAGSAALIKGNAVFIKAKNNAFESLFSQDVNSAAVAQVLYDVTGKPLSPRVYGADDGEKAKEKSKTKVDDADPIAAFTARARENGLELIIEE